jgi:chemotaxis protein methyltransferase CheR
MEEGGLLMLGAAETVIGQTQKFRASRAFRGFYELTPNRQSAEPAKVSHTG